MVIRTLFKEKISRFGSLISLLTLTTMLTLFSLFMPDLIATPSGRVFVVLWAVIAIVAFIAHARGLRVGVNKRYNAHSIMRKEERTLKKGRPQRLVRGL